MNAGEEGLLGVVGVPLLEVIPHRVRVRLEAGPGVGAERLRLAREDQARSVPRVVEGLDPDPVARAEEPPASRVPERERPHAVEALDAVVAPRLVGAEDHLGVGGATETVALRFELAAELA